MTKPRPVRFHHLKAVERNPRLARLKLEEPDDEDTDDRDMGASVEIGRGCHHLVFGTRRVVCYEGKRDDRVKAWQTFQAENADAYILTVSEYEKAQAMAEAVLFDPEAHPLLQGCVFEKTLLFELDGRPCRVTPDIRHPTAFVADFKSTKSAQPEEFLRDADRRRYYAQVAWQRLGTELALGYRPTEGYIIAVESVPPWPVTVVELEPELLDEGEDWCRRQLAKLIECETRDLWPSYRTGRVKWGRGTRVSGPWLAPDDEQAA